MFHDSRSLEMKSEVILWSCNTCKINFETRQELDSHVMNNDCWKDAKTKCPIPNCTKKFLTKKELKIHKSNQHSY